MEERLIVGSRIDKGGSCFKKLIKALRGGIDRNLPCPCFLRAHFPYHQQKGR